MKVLSLFDGMSCGQLALKKAGIEVSSYYASEIKNHGIKVTQENFPDTIQLGDVTKLRFHEGVLYSENGEFQVGDIDIVIGGSPCQNFSSACLKDKRLGLNGDKSKLFYDFLRILKEINPKYWLLENVASMDKNSRCDLNSYLGVDGILINSLDFLPQSRKRLYWTNIEVKGWEKKESNFQDYVDEGWYTPKPYSACLAEAHSRPNRGLSLVRRHLEKNFIPIVYKSESDYNELLKHYDSHYRGLSAKEVNLIKFDVDNSIYDCARVLSATEMERLQGVPEGYTKSINRNEAASLLGDGWTVDVIAHIFKGINANKTQRAEGTT